MDTRTSAVVLEVLNGSITGSVSEESRIRRVFQRVRRVVRGKSSPHIDECKLREQGFWVFFVIEKKKTARMRIEVIQIHQCIFAQMII